MRAKGVRCFEPTCATKTSNWTRSLFILYQLAQVRFPGEYRDTPKDVSRWVAECVFAFYAEHAQELGFDRLPARSLEQLERSSRHPLS